MKIEHAPVVTCPHPGDVFACCFAGTWFTYLALKSGYVVILDGPDAWTQTTIGETWNNLAASNRYTYPNAILVLIPRLS